MIDGAADCLWVEKRIPIIKVETPMALVRNENTFPFENKIQESFLQLKEFLNIARVLSGDDD